MVTSVIISIAVIVMILVLSLITISKGYGYKHSVDPLPKGKAANDIHDKDKKVNI